MIADLLRSHALSTAVLRSFIAKRLIKWKILFKFALEKENLLKYTKYINRIYDSGN